MGTSRLHRRQILWSALGGLAVAFVAIAAVQLASDVRHRVRLALDRANLAQVAATWDSANRTVRLQGEVARGSDRLKAEEVVAKVVGGDVTIANRITIPGLSQAIPED